MQTPVIEASDVSKTFGSLQAVKSLSFHVNADECFGFLGPNGAGKTTLLKMFYARTARDHSPQSRLRLFGYDPEEDELSIKYMSGVAPQEDNLDDELNVIQNLLLYARFYGMPSAQARRRADELLKFLELSEKRKELIRHLSGGMKRRLVIARALLNEPKLLILDEPTTGLDPQVRHLIWDKLRQLKKQGTTMLLTTHYMEEAFQLCDRLIIMHRGENIMEGSPRQLVAENIEPYVLEVTDLQANPELRHQPLPAGVRLDLSGLTARYYAASFEALKSLGDQFTRAPHFLRQTNLEDVFLKATGRMLDERQ
ncbi:MAG: ABC transporter ATP-binding protein [Planctomycetaceae bacterium]|nr:ABC transporter ATP-binding protein [Planctomycetaceae bacterium]